MSKALELNKENFSAEVLKSDQAVLVDFWAPWCTPCQMMAPMLDELAADLAGKVKITKVNTEDPVNQDLVIEYQIQSLPNLKLFKNGQVIGNFVGLLNKETLKGDIFALLNN